MNPDWVQTPPEALAAKMILTLTGVVQVVATDMYCREIYLEVVKFPPNKTRIAATGAGFTLLVCPKVQVVNPLSRLSWG